MSGVKMASQRKLSGTSLTLSKPLSPLPAIVHPLRFSHCCFIHGIPKLVWQWLCCVIIACIQGNTCAWAQHGGHYCHDSYEMPLSEYMAVNWLAEFIPIRKYTLPGSYILMLLHFMHWCFFLCVCSMLLLCAAVVFPWISSCNIRVPIIGRHHLIYSWAGAVSVQVNVAPCASS